MANILGSCSTSTSSYGALCIGIGTNSVVGGYNNIVIGNSNTITGYSWVDKTTSIQEYIEFGLKLMGIDLSFEDFSNMTETERTAFMRNHRLDNLLKNKED
jgi:hypothetical protein